MRQMYDSVEHSAEVGFPGIDGVNAYHWRQYKNILCQKTIFLLLGGSDICFHAAKNKDPSWIESAASNMKDITLFIGDRGLDVYVAGIIERQGKGDLIRKMNVYLQELLR